MTRTVPGHWLRCCIFFIYLRRQDHPALISTPNHQGLEMSLRHFHRQLSTSSSSSSSSNAASSSKLFFLRFWTSRTRFCTSTWIDNALGVEVFIQCVLPTVHHFKLSISVCSIFIEYSSGCGIHQLALSQRL